MCRWQLNISEPMQHYSVEEESSLLFIPAHNFPFRLYRWMLMNFEVCID